MARILDEDFVEDLISGQLSDCLDYVRNDDTLDLQIRENSINIYYRGGNALKVIKSRNNYQFRFETKYLKTDLGLSKTAFDPPTEYTDWYRYFPQAKQVMDFYLSKKRCEEREFQQLIVRENNYSSVTTGTDYFIIDIEYYPFPNARFDLVAVEWPSETSKRKLQKGYKPKLVIIEMKYGDGALTGDAGMKKHEDDFVRFTSDLAKLNDFKDEMISVFSQKRKLGLIPCVSGSKSPNQIMEFADEIDFAFLIANHDPEKSNLADELEKLNNQDTRFIVSNFMGYGIYNQSIFKLPAFKQQLKHGIH